MCEMFILLLFGDSLKDFEIAMGMLMVLQWHYIIFEKKFRGSTRKLIV